MSSYGVDASKGPANVSNPYDFKNVQVSPSFTPFAFISKTVANMLLFFSKNRLLVVIKTEAQLAQELPWVLP